jgi:pSer/pThr/pTyr-binding forkhead associated (FHA) protein
MPRINVVSGPAAGQSFEVEQEIVIGRDDADVTIPDPEVSRRHALVRPVAEGLVVQDLDSRNGTFVNGSRITGPVTLTSSGKIRLGQSDIDVEISLVGETSATGPPPREPRGSVRRVDEAAPTGGVVAVSDPAVLELAPTPRGETPPAAAAPRRQGPPWKKLLIAAAALIAAGGIAVGLVFALAGGADTKRRDLAATLSIVRLRIQGSVETLAGEQAGPPTGAGTATMVLTFSVPPQQISGPTPITGELTSRFDSGSYDSTFQGTLVPTQDGTDDVTGDGTITGGTGTFKGATGSFELSGDVDPQTNKARLTLDGSIEW